MLPSLHSMIGTIELEPPLARRSGCGDDSSLDGLLGGLAKYSSLSDVQIQRCDRLSFVASHRLSWRRGQSLVLQANLSQLTDDLQSEFEALGALLR